MSSTVSPLAANAGSVLNKTAAKTVLVPNMPAYYHGMSRLGMVVCAAVIGCGGGPKHVHKPGEEYLAAIKIEGNVSIKDDKLMDGLALVRAIGRGVDDYQV